ncbi:MAG: hypothetical protein BM564_11345 [Bacteroidetes bacterium MedPE-SWsnd-G2]|nr:MAG: hypothetical protein BM564_11345 [Bacteroidetes bacterium MedPE-SWsnd-G2]
MNYKFHLDKSSKKFNCPNCSKKTFVRYKDAELDVYLDAHIGRCDRESKCRYHHSPKGNIPLTSLENVEVNSQSSNHNMEVIGEYGRGFVNNNFITYLQRHFCNTDVLHVIQMYYIGTSNYWSNATVFWQIDEFMNVKAGKVMLYDSFSGKRVKKPFPHINWMHKVLQKKDFVLQQCLFGLHNLSESKKKRIGLVESEKTAIIMSVLRPDFIWMATGSKTNFKESLLLPLKGREIIAFPDKSDYEDWNKKAQKLRDKGFKIICSNMLEHHNLLKGDDLVDFMINPDFKRAS